MEALPATAPTVDAYMLAAAQAENARLIAVLESHGIGWRLPKILVVTFTDTACAEVKTPPSQLFPAKNHGFNGRI